MDRNRVIAWTCGLIVCLLVIMAGKSCADSSKTSKKTTSEESSESVESADWGIIYPEVSAESTQGVQYDMFGRPIRTTEPEPTEPTTDENGDIIEPVTEVFTDESGNVIEPPTEEPTEPETDAFGNIIEPETLPDEPIETAAETEASTEPTEYKPPPGFSGYDHVKYDEEGNPIPTIPPDFVIIID